MFLNITIFITELINNFVSVALDIVYIGAFFYVYHNFIAYEDFSRLKKTN